MPIILSTASSNVKHFVTVLVKCVKNMTHLYYIFAQGHWVAMPIILSTASSSVKRFVTVLVKCVKI